MMHRIGATQSARSETSSDDGSSHKEQKTVIQQGGDDVKRLKKEKHNDKSSEIEEIHCANCNREMLKTDNFCQYCGSPNEDEERDSFFDFHGISEEEEKFFKVIYRRRQIYRRIIYILILIIAIQTALLCMQ